ncbi:hypothetical protein ABQW55_005515 [Xanthomonas citri pv. malvacearum]|uniref:hypothetical protein n=1 Tax=Xanthomonas TaxID=338 RepID=UPI00062BBB96|nr:MULTISPECIES: hypothetical protein [Xanthomonas]KKY03853.1 hypothetical protein PK69_22555 [Xanthomonas phaseoli pv. phaseoli]MCC4631506.1 hypothetical protein [Xanthomonas citri]OOX02433.1 hypothetical protein Xmlv_18465 [Xanthomonas citri pv. malvacearum]WAW88069.1 hypothetical protein LPY96_06215 [Xanthomonas citri pv. malvacearum]WAW92200.1 hypothetical protein LPY95_05485 [Xanthomonas citri pv. malvacearum]
MQRFLFVVLAALAALPCSAQQSAAWPREHLGDCTSLPGEALPDFLKRAGVALHNYTSRTGNEACAMVATNGDAFSIRLGTDGVQRGCAVHHDDVLPGFRATGETIHSHPPRTTRLTARDLAWIKAYGMAMSGWSLNRKRGFSPDDVAGGPGWLVENKKLSHQANGQTTEWGAIAKGVAPQP